MNAKEPLYFAPSLFPSAPIDDLKRRFVGKYLKDVQAPAAVIDAAVVRRNCNLMLEAAEQIGVDFRAHVKTHKTLEITKLQVGPAPNPVRLVCSTVSEIEHLLPWLLECKAEGRHVDVLYGLPLAPSQIPRLGRIANQLSHNSLSLFVDHPSHIEVLNEVDEDVWEGLIPVWINIDVGYHREGVTVESSQLPSLAYALSNPGKTGLAGLYTHLGSSYASSSPEEALDFLATELSGLIDGADALIQKIQPHRPISAHHRNLLTLSLGATPTATSIQNLLNPTASSIRGAEKYTTLIANAKQKFNLELHAGVYTVNDLQQLATRARPSHIHLPNQPTQTLLSHTDIAFRVLAEVISVYPDRVPNHPEALIAAGTLALAREPCKSYPGWGVVTPWPEEVDSDAAGSFYDPDGGHAGWIVGRISQEHGILTWEGEGAVRRKWNVGEKVMVWPNHACIAAAQFGWFVVVDSADGDADVVKDVWVRWRGW